MPRWDLIGLRERAILPRSLHGAPERADGAFSCSGRDDRLAWGGQQLMSTETRVRLRDRAMAKEHPTLRKGREGWGTQDVRTDRSRLLLWRLLDKSGGGHESCCGVFVTVGLRLLRRG